MIESSISILKADTIELHYWLNDGTHTMDAYIFNKCEYEFLGIANELSRALNLSVEIEVEPLGEGGIRSWFKFKKNNNDAIKLAILVYLLTEILGTPLRTTLEILTKEALERVLEDPEIKKLEKEKKIAELELDIAKAKSETERLCENLDENKIRKKRSNYYETVSKCKKVEKITVTGTDSEKDTEYVRKEIYATDFIKYIMTSDELEPDLDDNAVIEIVSPVLKKGKYQWLGIYQGEVIQFKMKSNEFKRMVLMGQVPFKNGSSITCLLIKNKRIDSQGNVKVIGYEVTEVYNFFENDCPTETPEGCRKRQRREAEERQLTLFSDADFE